MIKLLNIPSASAIVEMFRAEDPASGGITTGHPYRIASRVLHRVLEGLRDDLTAYVRDQILAVGTGILETADAATIERGSLLLAAVAARKMAEDKRGPDAVAADIAFDAHTPPVVSDLYEGIFGKVKP